MQSVIRSTCRLASALKNTQLTTRCTCAIPQNVFHHRSYSTEVIPPPQAEGTDKVYAPKIQKIVEDISQLTLIEVADLNELLKKTLKIADAPMMAMGAMPAQAASQDDEEEEEEEIKPEKSLFTVKLTSFDAGKKVALIKEIKGLIEGMNLVQAKKFVESSPQIVKQEISKEEAEQLKETLSKVGASIEIE